MCHLSTKPCTEYRQICIIMQTLKIGEFECLPSYIEGAGPVGIFGYRISLFSVFLKFVGDGPHGGIWGRGQASQLWAIMYHSCTTTQAPHHDQASRSITALIGATSSVSCTIQPRITSHHPLHVSFIIHTMHPPSHTTSHITFNRAI